MTNYQDKPWLSNYAEGVQSKLDYKKSCLPKLLELSASKYPGKTALTFQGYTLTYAKLLEMVNIFATFLNEMGIKKGDSVAILLPNTIPCVVSYYALMKIGAVTVMNNPLYTDKELEHQFNDSGAKVLITLDLLGNRMIDLREKTGIKEIVISSIGDYLPFPKNILFPLVGKKKGLAADVKSADNLYRWKDIIAKYPPNPPEVNVDFDDLAMYQYTGGTTGVSKGVMLTHSNLSKQVQQVNAWFPEFKDGDEVMMGALPFFHIFGLSTSMNYAISKGWNLVLVPKPQPDPLIDTMRKFKPSFVPLVPTMYIGMLNHPDIDKTDLSFVKGCFSGSAPLPLEIIKDFESKTGVIVSEGFGLTESCPVTHINPFGGKWKIGSIGLPVADTECKIVDLDNGVDEVPVGEPGELCVKGPQVMKGYHNKPDATEDTLRDGWLYTGDIAKMDEEGYFFIVDRKKDLILSGGYNVYPRDIDEALYEHPLVQEACAIGIPHPTRGEAIKVFVVMKEGKTATQEELISYCGERLAKYKLPTEIEFRDELPKTNVGKILRKDLRAENQNK
ncbi:MAG: long-chain fatty acid--CoA ligase [Desulfobacterales bacterium]|nr:long-chain fatty acid--CoA ligase [Desulfobacterales bacterium]MCP4158448.1 long-chain fatty acid--CoA ligase [Deltaproteobacteria bacterium]